MIAHPASTASAPPLSSWMRIGRWLLLWLVAFDLLSSPLQAHAHHAAVDSQGAQHHADLHVGTALLIEGQEHHHTFEHVLTGLRPADTQRWSPKVRPISLGPLSVLPRVPQTVLRARPSPRAGVIAPDSGGDLLLPETRAPPRELVI